MVLGAKHFDNLLLNIVHSVVGFLFGLQQVHEPFSIFQANASLGSQFGNESLLSLSCLSQSRRRESDVMFETCEIRVALNDNFRGHDGPFYCHVRIWG